MLPLHSAPFLVAWILLLLVSNGLMGAHAAPATASEPRPSCSRIQVRREWRDMTVRDRRSYLQAVLCLQSLPPIDPTRPARTRFEDFQLTHILLTGRVHLVGHFLPWHRQFITLYSTALRDECGYRGPVPYWDWSRDADTGRPFIESPIFDPVTGFGGDGVPGTYTLPPDPLNISFTQGPFEYRGCVDTGVFAHHTSGLGPGMMETRHCLVRGVNDNWRSYVSGERVRLTLEKRTYGEFTAYIDDLTVGIHPGGHLVVGGEMTNPYSSGIDPLFYLHHAALDRVWWLWQKSNSYRGLYEMSGYTTQNGTEPSTLDFVMDFPVLGPNITVREVMDPRVWPNCFVYDD